MHIPDGYLGPKTFVSCYLLTAPFWTMGILWLKKNLQSYQVPLLSLGAAFVFVIQMLNVPIPGGTTGHAVGSSLLVIALGLWPAVLATSLALLVQAVVFGDGGITAFGANCLNMAVVQPIVTYVVWTIFRPRDPGAQPGRSMAAAFAAGYAGLFAAAFTTAVMFGIQPALERAPDTGLPLYSPYPLGVAVSAMMISHLFFGLIEGFITSFAVGGLLRVDGVNLGLHGLKVEGRPVYKRPAVLATMAALVIILPLGLLAPDWFKAGEAWGEWAPEEAAELAGLSAVPAGMEKYAETWTAPIPDYSFRESESVVGNSLQYVVSGVLGIGLIVLFFLVIEKLPRVLGGARREQT